MGNDYYRFLSTLPARGATSKTALPTGQKKLFLSTLPARGATSGTADCAPELSEFLSTLPARGATQRSKSQSRCRRISIHAPREGSD